MLAELLDGITAHRCTDNLIGAPAAGTHKPHQTDPRFGEPIAEIKPATNFPEP